MKMNKCDDIIYEKSWLKNHEGLFIVRLYDGFDNIWMDVSKELSFEEAMKTWREKTEDGMKNYEYDHIDYYEVFPSDTRMIYS